MLEYSQVGVRKAASVKFRKQGARHLADGNVTSDGKECSSLSEDFREAGTFREENIASAIPFSVFSFPRVYSRHPNEQRSGVFAFICASYMLPKGFHQEQRQAWCVKSILSALGETSPPCTEKQKQLLTCPRNLDCHTVQ